MRNNSLLLVAMVLTVFLAGSLWGEATLEVEEATLVVGSSGNVLIISMDNPNEDVALWGMEITFETACFTVTGMDKTARSEDADILGYMDTEYGIKIAYTCVDHVIAAGSGPVAEITVDVGDCTEGDYLWDVHADYVSCDCYHGFWVFLWNSR